MLFPKSAFFPFFFPAAALCKNRGGGRNSKRGMGLPSTLEREFGTVNDIKGGMWMCSGSCVSIAAFPGGSPSSQLDISAL